MIQRIHTLAAFTRVEFFIVLIIIAIFIGVLYPAVQASRRDYGGWADPLPQQTPQEKNRVQHETGFSIVIPEGWRQPEGIVYANQTRIEAKSGFRFESSLVVQLAKPDSDTANFTDDFAFGDLNLKSWQTEHEGPQFDTRWFAFETLYPVGDRQYLISFTTHADVDGLPDSVAAYICTIRPSHDGG